MRLDPNRIKNRNARKAKNENNKSKTIITLERVYVRKDAGEYRSQRKDDFDSLQN